MATVFGQHWRRTSIQLAVLLAIAVFATRELLVVPVPAVAQSAAAAAPPTPAAGPAAPAASPSIDPVTWVRVQRLRSRLALTDLDLSAAGCTPAQAGQVLSGLLGWYGANAGGWDRLEVARDAAARQLQEAVRQVNVGPADPAVLAAVPTLQQASTAAAARMDQLTDSAAAIAAGVLTTGQQSVWAIARANLALGVPDRYRFAQGLTAARASSLSAAWRRGGAAAADATLGGLSAAVPAAVAANLSASADGVAAADAAILPEPASLQLVPPGS